MPHSVPAVDMYMKRITRIRSHLSEDVTPHGGDIFLIVGCFVTGLLDAAVFNVWSCFVSMQTGNTVYVGLGFTGQPLSQPYRWAKSGTSILSFMIGSYCFSRLMRYLSPHRRSTLFISTILQALLILVSALLVSLGIVPPHAGELLPDNMIVLLPLTLLAFQAGGQCVLSRILGYGEIPTVVLTSAYCDLGMDERIFAGLGENTKRNRRIGSVIVLVGGAGVGGWLTLNEHMGWTLWLLGGIKVAMALSWLGWRRSKVELE